MRKEISETESIRIEKVLKGDNEAFRYFIHTYKDFAFALSWSIVKSEYLAEESVQNAFIRAFENLKKFRQDATFKTWFGRIVINESLRNVRSAKSRTTPMEEMKEGDMQQVEDTLCSITNAERRQYISEAFELMAPKESLVLELFYLKENSLKEIAEITGWSISKIKMLLVRSRKSFFGILKEILKNDLYEIL